MSETVETGAFLEKDRLLTINQLAEIINMSSEAIRMARHRGKENSVIPPALNIGRNLRWSEITVYRWIRQQAIAQNAWIDEDDDEPLRGRGR